MLREPKLSSLTRLNFAAAACFVMLEIDGANTFKGGITVFEPLSKAIGIPYDQINLMFCFLSSIPLALIYNRYFGRDRVGRTVRLIVPIVFGLAQCYICYGVATSHLFLNIGISYIIMISSPIEYMHLSVMGWTLGHLLFIHIYRWWYLDQYSLDVTGAIMVAVQKVTSIAFSLHDGRARKKEELTKSQKQEAIIVTPSVLEFASYMLNFQTVLIGPLVFFSDYKSFIDDTHVLPDVNGNYPCPVPTGLRKVLEACFYMLIHTVSGLIAPAPEMLVEPEYYNLPFGLFVIQWFIAMQSNPFKYYFAWSFTDGICNLSGFGFNGYDKHNGQPRWDLCTNVRPTRVEFAQNYRAVVENWNINTARWLRRIAYDRTPKHIRTVATYLLSAVWHGFSAGYYVAFLTSSLFTLAAATWRRCMRWRFMENEMQKLIYDIFSFAVTKFAIMYAFLPFSVLKLSPALWFYWKFLFVGHLIGLFVQFGLPLFCKQRRTSVDASCDDAADEVTKTTKSDATTSANVSATSLYGWGSKRAHRPAKVDASLKTALLPSKQPSSTRTAVLNRSKSRTGNAPGTGSETGNATGNGKSNGGV